MNEQPSERQQYLTQAKTAANKAAQLAEHAEAAARHNNKQMAPLATAGALWADVARSYAALAQALPEDTDQTPAEG